MAEENDAEVRGTAVWLAVQDQEQHSSGWLFSVHDGAANL